MISLLVSLLGLVLLVSAWILYRRWALRSLNWSTNLDALRMARKCQKYMRLWGIDLIYLDPKKKWGPNAGGGPVNLIATGDQFHKKLPNLKVICGDKAMYLGETFFMDIIESRSKNKDWKSLFLVLRPLAPSQTERHLAETNCVPVLQPADLRDLAQALQMLKAGMTPIYEGRSPTLARTLKTGSIGLRGD